MILSEKHGFIFIKGMKVASTRTEMALSLLCGPDDIITPIAQVDELERLKLGACPRNWAATREEEVAWLARLQAALARLERMSRTTTSDTRKKDTREKIELGGLIVKAGLRYEKRALLMGLLIDAADRIRGDETERARLLALGEKAFVDGAD